MWLDTHQKKIWNGKQTAPQRGGAKTLLPPLGSQGSSDPLQELSRRGCSSWHPWWWLLSPPCPSQCQGFPCNTQLCKLNTPAMDPILCQEHSNPMQPRLCPPSASCHCRSSFPETHIRCSALINFRNVFLPRIK